MDKDLKELLEKIKEKEKNELKKEISKEDMLKIVEEEKLDKYGTTIRF